MDEARLCSRLRTPRSELPGENTSRLILECEEFLDIQRSFQEGTKDFDQIIEAAQRIGNLVRATLYFESTNIHTPVLRPESLAATQQTNCIGHTLVASELLERIGVDHLVSFVNQHAVLLFVDHASNRSFMLDTAVESFCQETTRVIGGKDPLDQLATGRLRAINRFYSREFLKKLPKGMSPEHVFYTYPWLTFSKTQGAHYREEDSQSYILQLISFPPIPGRMLLNTYYDAFIHELHSNHLLAADCLKDLLYPDLDPRNEQGLAYSVVKWCIQNGLYADAIELAIAVDESLEPDDMSRNKSFLPDTLRTIAKRMGNAALLQLAIATYEKRPTKLNYLKARKARREHGAMLQSNKANQ